MNHSIFRLGALCTALLLASAAQAQETPSQPAPAQHAPAATQQKAPAVTDAQTFGDWGVRCVSGAVPPCEMFQTAQNKDGKRIMSIAIAYMPPQGKYVLLLTTPLGVSFAKGVKITASAYSPKPLPYLRCDNAGCYVEGFIDTSSLDALSQSAAQASVTIAAVNGHEIKLPLSLNGFSNARAAMNKLAREKSSAALSAAASH